jgi:hypothetical protein
MKPGIINGEALTYDQNLEVWTWLQSNGVRHHIPADAKIVITGNWIVAPTWDIGRASKPRYTNSGPLPIKIRRYRIRNEHLHITPKPMTKRELRSAANKAETDAVMALCRHDKFLEGCETCEFRKDAAVEHMQRVISQTLWCISGVHTECPCEDPDD